MTHAAAPDLRLGLIGDNIARSRSPLLHRLAGVQNGIVVQYDSLIPRDLGQDFETVFDACAAGGYRGINITYPYKERAATMVRIDDPLVRAIGAINTVLFDDAGPQGRNTDHSGFIAAYRAVRGDAVPGAVCLIGTGGVGRAIAFGLIALGAREIRLIDKDSAKAEGLAADLRPHANGARIATFTDAVTGSVGATGLINATPVGMVGYDGTPLPGAAMAGAEWAFDAVYTPVETRFLRDAQGAGLSIISGYELFFYQGVHAWAHFAGLPLDEAGLRRALLADGEAA